jgi:16S rRNA (cytosine1402-N4)-methyltransferase
VPLFEHKPVMLSQAIEALKLEAGARYVDGTLGGGGHAAAILAGTSPNGWLYGCDRDGAAVEAARERLAPFAGRFELRQANFAGLADWIEAGSCAGVLLDLGVSSPQLDSAPRGFSFVQDGPLDMRMDRRQGLTAADLVNQAGADELARLFWELGGEPQARRFARTIAAEREKRPFNTTGQLAGLIERLAPRLGKKTHPATRVFQALRMAVNDEIGSLQKGLASALALLQPRGRLVIITFHSVEDRVVKEFGRERARDYTFPGAVDVPELRQPRNPEVRWVFRKARKPEPGELAANPRSRSAQLRVLEKL